ncbi:MAG: toll/interleukin-1 receptor domain-containing protein, partial [Clostridium sp.]|nr:toll/interleukin-1 receptor domain-containing protein [Clostridium sp.]
MKRYLAFISYRHLPDSNDAALGIRKGLEGYHLPKNCPLPKRRRVFRDTDELPTSSDLGMDIENALRDSEYLIALCSEDYLQSKWCLREVEIYIESGRKDRILPVLLSGTPETSVPAEIRDLPVAADLRAEAPGRPYDKKKVRPAIPELLAVMSGMDPDRISGAEFKFRAGVAAGAAACLAAGLMGFALYASYTADRIADNNTRIAEAAEQTAREEKQALQERDSALLRQSEYLAEQAWEALKEEDINEAIRLALSALPDDLHGDLPVSPEAEGVLRVALSMEMPPSYHLSYTAETDYDIRGYYIYPYIDDRTFLTTDRFGIGQPYVDYFGETGVVETVFSESRQQAMDLGYTHLLHLAGDANAIRHYYYGPGRQMYSENTGGSYHVDYTLDGEPFCAAGAVLDPEYGGVVAWEGPGEGREPRTVLLGSSGAEPTAILDIEGVPVSVGFSTNATFICLVDEAGTLHIYDNKGV